MAQFFTLTSKAEGLWVGGWSANLGRGGGMSALCLSSWKEDRGLGSQEDQQEASNVPVAL